MRPESKKLIWDAREAASAARAFIADRDYPAYAGDPMVRSAVERQLEIVGEALHRLSRADPEVAGKIEDLPRIVGLRNVLAHGYADIDDRLVWDVVQSKLPPLQSLLESLLREP